MLNAFKLFYPYFNHEEVTRFRQICNYHGLSPNRSLCSSKFDALWQPFLNRLNRMDPSISNQIPYDGKIRPWRYPQFIEGFEKLDKKYSDEVKLIEINHPELVSKHLDPRDFRNLSLLEQLELKHARLQIIRNEINKNLNNETNECRVLGPYLAVPRF